MTRKPHPSDASDAEWELVAPSLTLMTEDAPQREYPLREVFNGLRWKVRFGATWRMMPNNLPPWNVVYHQMLCWIKAQVFKVIANDLRALLRIAEGRNEQPTAAIFDSRTLQSTPESCARACYDGAKRRKGNKVHLAADTLGHLFTLQMTAADQQDRAQVAELRNEYKWIPVKQAKSPLWIRDTLAKTQQMLLLNTVSSWKWSNYRQQKEALSRCLAAGWSSEVPDGWLDFVG